MPLSKIKLDHTGLGTNDFVSRGREIIAANTGNAVFVDLEPRLAPLGVLLDTLVTKETAVDTTDQAHQQALTERDTARAAANEGFSQLASGAEGITRDDAQLQSGGWHLRAARTPVGPMPAPQNVSATPGDKEGETDLMCEPVYGVQTYVGQHATSPTGPWTQFYIGKKSSCTATGLASGQLHYFRFQAIGAAGPGPWSDIAQCRAS